MTSIQGCPSKPRHSYVHRYCKFTLALSLILGIWLLILPRLAKLSSIRHHIDRNQAQGIDPGAMFYTEVGDLVGYRIRHSQGQTVITRRPLGHRD